MPFRLARARRALRRVLPLRLRWLLGKRKTVIIVGIGSGWKGDAKGCEVWGVNKTYLNTVGLTRTYFFDRLWNCTDQSRETREEFVDILNAMDVPVYAKMPYPEIPKSRRYPIEAVMRYFDMVDGDGTPDIDKAYFTSTVAYMEAHAIYEGFESIILHRMYAFPTSLEYFHQKPGLDYFVGWARGSGIHVLISSDSHIAKPFPWQTGLYGYIEQKNEEMAHECLAGAAAAAMRIPAIFQWCPELGMSSNDDILRDSVMDWRDWNEINPTEKRK